jgi:electron transport complex protein RnfA
MVVWRYFHKLFKQIKKFVHLTVFNCAVLGALFLNSQAGGGILSYIGYGLGTALGFSFAGYLLYIAYDRLNSELVPAAFRGMPIMIIYVGILSMALHAFAGYVT